MFREQRWERVRLSAVSEESEEKGRDVGMGMERS